MARVGFSGARPILGQHKAVTRGIYRTNHSRGVGVSVGTGGASGTQRRKYRGSRSGGASRRRQNEAMSGGWTYKEMGRRWEDVIQWTYPYTYVGDIVMALINSDYSQDICDRKMAESAKV
jgi:hypothetical protein